ncbi:hypothetical protein BJ741DRAFT_706826 [Chytriomyces cf. hyalinus JEL632]|nr:hypothetical protein BJ741DRAFT_706826 [Chytriomyces cf. hyalinus JEL632]
MQTRYVLSSLLALVLGQVSGTQAQTIPPRQLNVLGTPLEVCSKSTMTGFYRTGSCQTGPQDQGMHTVCANVTTAFLAFQKRVGNDLITPRTEYSFPGLQNGDVWCICALRWKSGLDAGFVTKINLAATNEKTLRVLGMTLADIQAVAVLLPSIHGALLMHSNLSNSVIATFGSALITSVPVLFPCSNYAADSCIKGFYFFFLMRTLEMSTFPRTMNRKWSITDYGEFVATSSNNSVRQLESMQQVARREWKPRTVQPSERTFNYFLRVFIRLMITTMAYAVGKAYCLKHAYVSLDGFLNPFHAARLMDHAMFAVTFFCDIELAYTLGTLPMVMLFKAPYTPIFDQPYFATSLRDFWSRRWNYPIKLTIHRLAFIPTQQLLSYSGDTKKKVGAAPPLWHSMIATLSAFALSALFHEYIVFILIRGETHGTSSIFFMIHGMLCIAHVWFQKASGFGKTWGTGVFWNGVSWLLTMSVLFVTCPLFVGPYARSGVMLQFPIPGSVLKFLQAFM